MNCNTIMLINIAAPFVLHFLGMVDIVSFAHSLVIVRTEAVFVSLYSLVVSRWQL